MNHLAMLYQQLDPAHPLEPEETELYVDWQQELDADDVKTRLVAGFRRSGSVPVTRLLTGHRGVGKTTELKRVKQRLEEGSPRCFVSLLEAEKWLSIEDVAAPDVVLHIVRQLVDDLAAVGIGFGKIKLAAFFGELSELLGSEAELKNISVTGGPLEFGLALKNAPHARAALRRTLEGQLPHLYDLINLKVLEPARQELDKIGYDDLVVLVDQLDRIPQKVLNDRGLTNHENLFLDQAGPLRALSCHTLYTLPIELAYSSCKARLTQVYGSEIFTLPMIPVVTREGTDYEPGLGALHAVVERRCRKAGLTASALLEAAELRKLCRLSGGHVRHLFLLLRSAIDRSEALPLRHEALSRAVRRNASDMALALTHQDWQALDEVRKTKSPIADGTLWLRLLRDLYVYQYEDEHGIWFEPNPLLAEVKRRSEA